MLFLAVRVRVSKCVLLFASSHLLVLHVVARVLLLPLLAFCSCVCIAVLLESGTPLSLVLCLVAPRVLLALLLVVLLMRLALACWASL